MANFEAWKTIDLKTARRVEPYPGTLFTGDSRANLFGVAVLRDGEPVDLTGGSVSGKVARDDGQTVQGTTGAIGGANNKAYIVLPQAAYDVPGNITITLRHTAGSTETVLGAWSAYVWRSGTGSELSPGDVVPSLDEIQAEIAAMRTATANANAAYNRLINYAQSVQGATLILPT